MVAWRRVLPLGLSLLVAVASSGKRFEAFTSCAACVDAGFGWSAKKSKCGMFANKDCGSRAALPEEAHTSGDPPPPPQSYFGALPIIGAVPRMKWNLSDPFFATKLARRRTPVVLTDSPASTAWRGFDKWAEPGYLEHHLPEPINFAKSYDPNFMYYNKRHSWAEEARRIRAAPAQRLGAPVLSLCPPLSSSPASSRSRPLPVFALRLTWWCAGDIGPQWGNWVVPSVDIKLTLAGFHREV
jgi:hypothetical protein